MKRKMMTMTTQEVVDQCNRLGVIFSNGDNVKQNLDKAFQLFEKAAEHGHAPAKENLARILIMGPDHLKDVQRGITLCLDALDENSHSSVFYTLACAYEKGAGVKQNIDIAFYFYQMAVAMGAAEDIPHAENELKRFKHNGISVKPLKHVDFFPKSNRIFDMAMLTLKALALSLDIPVVIQKTVSHEHDFNDFNKPTLTDSVPFAEYLDDKADRIVVAYYDEKDGNVCQNLQVVKDNKNSTGKVLMTKEKNYYDL